MRGRKHAIFALSFNTMASACYVEIKMLAFFFILYMCSSCHCISYPFECIAEMRSEYDLPDLPFDYEDLEPYIDSATLKVHHRGHHAGYTRKLNAALQLWRTEEPDSYVATSILNLLKHLDDIPPKYQRSIRNNGGGFVNHNIYWSTMAANRDNDIPMPSGDLLNQINATFGSFQEFKNQFTSQALTLFGSGYVWLSQRNPSSFYGDNEEELSRLIISTTANQDTPISDGHQPILVLDVWEHAYYLKHQNKRDNHIADWWKVVDWSAVANLKDWWSRDQYEVHDEL
ncbi:superoxide dismutase [Mn]-like [Lytechinus variegatus]|uniref:superoxide dismutase [Mn]-like n=1 Tax=Lytechinus variegatus TaxID=7654 RepID=UPI001BB1B7D1|nr:superoxide dismutase [Mn]-like [Lytechinus variegatus]